LLGGFLGRRVRTDADSTRGLFEALETNLVALGPQGAQLAS
jgi:hypothetical protein